MVNMTVAPTMPLGERLSWGRKMAGLDQTEMGKRVGASRPTISLWERGEREPSFSQVVIWAREIGQPLEWLAEGVNAKTASSEDEAVLGTVRPKGFEPLTFWSVVSPLETHWLRVSTVEDMLAIWEAEDVLSGVLS